MAEVGQGSWEPDPFGRFDHRWWDGSQWTANVSVGGEAQLDPQGVQGGVPTTRDTPQRVRDQVAKGDDGTLTSMGSGGTLFTEPVLVVNQKAKLLELNNEYAVYDQHGQQLGAIRQVGQSKARKALRLLTDVDQFLTHKLELVDAQGRVQLRLTRPAKLVKSRVLVESADGRSLGELVQQNAIGKIRFDMVANGQSVGSLNAENWRAWNFAILDQGGQEVARITKTWEGLAKTMFTTADNYVVKIHRELSDPLRTLVVASAVTVDTALKQDSRGFN